MRHPDDDGSEAGSASCDPRARYEGRSYRERARGYDRDEEMRAGRWSGGRGREWPSEHGPHAYAPWPAREHGGFSNYAGGGSRDRYREPDVSREPGRRPDLDESWGMSREPVEYQAKSAWTEGEWTPADPYARYRRERPAESAPPRWGGYDERGPYYGKGPKGYKRSDERIREELCEAIAQQGFIDASDVEVFVEAGVVRLAGTVMRREDKRALENMAERVHGVDDVRNELRLRREEARVQPWPQDADQGPASAGSGGPHNGRNARA